MRETRQAIHDLLAANTDVTDIVGTKIFSIFAPQGQVPPFIIFRIIGTDPTDTKDGASDLDTPFADILSYHDDADQAQDLATKVRIAIDRFSGVLNDVVIQSIRYDDGEESFDVDIEKPFVEQMYKVRIATASGTALIAAATTQYAQLPYPGNVTSFSNFDDADLLSKGRYTNPFSVTNPPRTQELDLLFATPFNKLKQQNIYGHFGRIVSKDGSYFINNVSMLNYVQNQDYVDFQGTPLNFTWTQALADIGNGEKVFFDHLYGVVTHLPSHSIDWVANLSFWENSASTHTPIVNAGVGGLRWNIVNFLMQLTRINHEYTFWTFSQAYNFESMQTAFTGSTRVDSTTNTIAWNRSGFMSTATKTLSKTSEGWAYFDRTSNIFTNTVL